MNKKYERMIDDLDPQELKRLESIKTVNDIKSVKLIDTWSDDHLPCVGVKINGVEVSFWWLEPVAAAAFEYTDSVKAKKTMLRIIQTAIKVHKTE